MALMAWRRIVSFASLLTAGRTITFDLPEFIALIISGLMLLGVLYIGAYFRSIRTAEEKREQAENDLRKSAAKFREISGQFHALLDAIPDSITLQSPDLKVLWANNSAAWLNKNPGEVVGDYCYKLWHNRTDPCEPCPVIKSFNTGEPAIETITKQDNRIWEIRTIPIMEESRVVNVIEVGRDITERKQAEETIQLQLKRLNTLRSIEKAITSSLDLSVTLDMLLNQATTQLGIDAAAILLLNQRTQILEYSVSKGFRSNALKYTQLRLGESNAGRAAIEHRIITIPNLKEMPGGFVRSKLFANEDFMAYFAVPLITKGQVKGILELFHRSPLNTDQGWLEFLETTADQAAMAIDNAALFEGLQRSNNELTLAYDTTIEGWSQALDMRDKETEGHSQRVTNMTLRMARILGIKDEEIIHIRRGALLHDIGKMGVPDNILLKPGALTEEEWKIMKLHPVYAHELLSPIEYLRPALDIPYYHHEKWDGSGYPKGLEYKDIPLSARIFGMVDVWDALCSDRPYRLAWTKEKVREHIRSLSGLHFDPEVVEVFFNIKW
jgi:HD-GYP domain-containing protein (c-di-GMP phosphodiesterase class II)